MKKMLIMCLLSIHFICSGCSTTEKINNTSKNKSNEKASQLSPSTENSSNEIPLSKKIYGFQHKLIPKWVFESEGKFFSDIKSGNISKLASAASEVVSPEYAIGVTVTPIENKEAVLITFPEPEDMAHCYFAIVEKIDSNYRYITYEKTFSFGDSKFVGAVGGWNEHGGHDNYGPRLYKTASEFIKDVLKL
jgi:hypothetical protein